MLQPITPPNTSFSGHLCLFALKSLTNEVELIGPFKQRIMPVVLGANQTTVTVIATQTMKRGFEIMLGVETDLAFVRSAVVQINSLNLLLLQC